MIQHHPQWNRNQAGGNRSIASALNQGDKMNYKLAPKLAAVIFYGLIISANWTGAVGEVPQGKTQLHATTNWRIEPSFKFDLLCFLNTLTGDSFYVEYYPNEYREFKPLLTPAAQAALADLKRKIKDENQGIISASLCLYFSATDDQTLDDMLKTLKNSDRMQSNLKQTPYYSEEDWRLFEGVREDLKTILLFLKNIQFESYWARNVLPRVSQKIRQIEKDLPGYNVIKEVEIIPGKGSGQLKKKVLRFLAQPEIKKLYHRIEKDSKNFGKIYVYFKF